MALTKVRGAGAEGLTLSSTALTIANGLTLTDGNVTLASGHGIDFSATANSSGSVSAELLDDYEEGTFTAKSGVTQYYASYTKVGKIVFINVDILTGTLSGSSTFTLNVPFASLDSYGTGSFNYQTSASPDATVNIESSSGIHFRTSASGGNLTDANASGRRFIFNGIYHTAS